MRHRSQRGFSLLELLIVVAITMVVIAIALPQFLTAAHTFRTDGAAGDISGVIQQTRLVAIQKNTFYSIKISPQTGNTVKTVFGDLANSGSYAALDPEADIAAEVSVEASSSAPSTSTLQSNTSFLPTGSTALLKDGSTNSITFGPDGLPCFFTSVTGGTVCNSRGGATAYWLFLQNTTSQQWDAVTITPAGRIQRWRYNGSTWIRI